MVDLNLQITVFNCVHEPFFILVAKMPFQEFLLTWNFSHFESKIVVSRWRVEGKFLLLPSYGTAMR